MPDTFVPDTFVEDTLVPDTFMPDTFVPDTFVPDTFVADTAVAVDAVAEEPAPKLPAKPELTVEFKRCSNGSECPSGFCVEGVCCNSACNQRCFSCALLNTPGTCTQEPIGVDLKSECGPALTCLGTCGEGAECIGAGTGTMCARNRCTGPTTGAGPAYCSSPGAKCNTDETVAFDCAPFVCEPAFGACRTTCASSNDCAQGFLCDTASKTCVAAPPPPAESGDSGCAVSSPNTSNTSRGALAFAASLVALGLVARRRRRSRLAR
jgi:MYXO-CTERM domain-containing protein